MSDKKIKSEKSDLGFKDEPSNMMIDDEDEDNIFDGDGNLDSDQNEKSGIIFKNNLNLYKSSKDGIY